MKAAIILAAGESRRMGSAKLLLKHQAKSLLGHAIEKALSCVDDCIVVVGAFETEYRAEAQAARVRIVVNKDWRLGMGASVKVGFQALSANVDQVLLMLADQPFIAQEHLQALLAAKADLVFSNYPDGNLGVPAVVTKPYFPRARTLPNHCGAKALIDQHARLSTVSLKAATSVDIDTPEDAERWLRAE